MVVFVDFFVNVVVDLRIAAVVVVDLCVAVVVDEIVWLEGRPPFSKKLNTFNPACGLSIGTK